VRDHQHREIAAPHHLSEHSQDFVGLAGREHRGGLVENEKAALQIELLEYFAFCRSPAEIVEF
jgi:hypothetical protein